MKSLRIALTALVAVLAGALVPAPTRASTALLGNGSQSGGWTASAPDGADVHLDVLGIVNDTLVLKKTATFSDGPTGNGFFSPLPIQFLKNNSGISKIVIDFEDIANNTGTTWGSFSLTVVGNNVSFDAASAQGFDGDKFKGPNELSALANNQQTLKLTNGTVADGEHFLPGLAAGSTGGNLIINAGAGFSLNEQPGAGQSVPLPAAAWMGLSGLVGMGAIGKAKKFFGRRA